MKVMISAYNLLLSSDYYQKKKDFFLSYESSFNISSRKSTSPIFYLKRNRDNTQDFGNYYALLEVSWLIHWFFKCFDIQFSKFLLLNCFIQTVVLIISLDIAVQTPVVHNSLTFTSYHEVHLIPGWALYRTPGFLIKQAKIQWGK